VALFRPLRRRDFALLFAGAGVSLVGDGIYTVALAFQVYALDNDPAALSIVLLCNAVGLVASAPWSGVVIDRLDRRMVIVVADAVQLAAVLALGLLSVAGALDVWQCAVASAVLGAGTAFVRPASTALLPAVVAPDEVVAATSLQQSAHHLSIALAGPALGGAIVGLFGPGTALLLDATTFAASMAAVALVHTRDRPVRGDGPSSVVGEMREGWAYVRAHTWVWGALLAACIAVLCFSGPVQVALPYVVKNDWGRDAGAYGLLLAVAGLGAVAASLVFGARGLRRRPVTLMLALWALEGPTMAACALAGDVGVALPFALAYGVGGAGDTVWFAMLQTRVPPRLLGRVSSLDWLLSMALLPVSFALTGPLAAALGARELLVGASLLGAATTIALLVALPGLRERGGRD
jgi:MFS family permease